MSVSAAIRKAERLLPGRAARKGSEDPRWQAIIEVGEFVKQEPEEVWRFARRWGANEQEDVRNAIATCILEHLLEHHFELLLERITTAAKEDARFLDTLRRCWRFGQAEIPENAKRLDRLLKDVRRAN